MDANKDIYEAREHLKSAIDKIASVCGFSSEEKKALKLKLDKKDV